MQAVLQILQTGVMDQKLQAFYPPGSLEPIAQRVAQSGALARLAQEWKMPMEIASDLALLALFDTILYVDDSGSMAFEQDGERIDDLKLILNRVAFATSLFDQDGIQGQYKVITITDGAPAGEDRYTIVKVISNANRELARTRYGPDSISFQFAQVGNDMKAQKFLEELDNHPEIGGLIDCTSNYEAEEAEMLRKSGQSLSPDLWIVKMLLGGISSEYDDKDESK
ncbi:hypothetical protein EMMF5_000728 [Cystobasidiomycetes sp. EMM_F5]